MNAYPWHMLLGPLPSDATVKRHPVASPELPRTHEMSAIAGWETLTVELSAGAAGLRHVMVVLDATGRPISVGDHVLFCRDVSATPMSVAREHVHESIGGRLEADGTFQGTRWRIVNAATDGDDELEQNEVSGQEITHTAPTPEDIARIKALVVEILERDQAAR